MAEHRAGSDGEARLEVESGGGIGVERRVGDAHDVMGAERAQSILRIFHTGQGYFRGPHTELKTPQLLLISLSIQFECLIGGEFGASVNLTIVYTDRKRQSVHPRSPINLYVLRYKHLNFRICALD